MAMTQTNEPSCLVLTRQALPTIDRTRYASAEGLANGAYVLADAKDGAPEVILMATGSEVSLVLAAHERLVGEGIASRVVSMPSWSVFEKQDAAYREAVLPRAVRARLAVEQAGAVGWDRYVGFDGGTITMSTFGASAPLAKLQAKYGFTVDNVCDRARALIASLGDDL
jgi:transketolase